MRVLIIKEGCPICGVVLQAVNRFNSNAALGEGIEVLFYEVGDTRIHAILNDVATKDEQERGLATPVLVFDGFVLRREKVWHGVSDPIEIEATLEGLHKEKHNLVDEYRGIYF